MKLIVNKHAGASRPAGETWGRSPGAAALGSMHIINRVMDIAQSEEALRIQLCISFWESRKVRGWLALFYFCHNLHCGWRADAYRKQLSTLMNKGNC